MTLLCACASTTKWRPNQRQLLKCLVFHFVRSAKVTKILWYHGPARQEMLSIRAETTVSTCSSVEIARLEKKKEDEQLAVMTNSSLVLPRLLLATLTVFVVTEHSSMKVRYPQSLTTAVLAEFSWLPFVAIHMACLCHPYIQSLPTVIPRDRRRTLVMLRTGCLPLAFETGRYWSPKVPLDKRTCQVCSTNSTEHQVHFIAECPAYDDQRVKLFLEASKYIHDFYSLSSTAKTIGIIRLSGYEFEVVQKQRELSVILNYYNFRCTSSISI